MKFISANLQCKNFIVLKFKNCFKIVYIDMKCFIETIFWPFAAKKTVAFSRPKLRRISPPKWWRQRFGGESRPKWRRHFAAKMTAAFRRQNDGRVSRPKLRRWFGAIYGSDGHWCLITADLAVVRAGLAAVHSFGGDFAPFSALTADSTLSRRKTAVLAVIGGKLR